MILETKYNLGDKVYIISRRQEEKWTPCSLCEGTGKIELKNGNVRECPECYGSKGKTEYQPSEWRVGLGKTRNRYNECWDYWPESGRIGQVTVIAQKESQKVEYMLKETGVGSGTIWKETELCPSLEEAQTECDRRNKE